MGTFIGGGGGVNRRNEGGVLDAQKLYGSQT